MPYFSTHSDSLTVRGNPGYKPRMSLRATAPVLDPTNQSRNFADYIVSYSSTVTFFSHETTFASVIVSVAICSITFTTVA